MKRNPLTGTFHKTLQLVDVKARNDGPGGFEGYGSIFNNVDSYGDVVLKGAFLRTIPQFLVNGFASVGHAWSDISVATFSGAHEDDKGLWVTADFHTDDFSQRARKVYSERIAREKSVGLSIGFAIADGGAIYATDQDGFSAGIRLLKDLDLFEVSLVNVPANPQALAESVKSMQTCDDQMCGCRLGSAHHIGMKFADHAEALRTELTGFTERAKAHIAMLAKEKRTPSEDNVERFTALRDEWKSALLAFEGLLEAKATEPVAETDADVALEIARFEALRAYDLMESIA